MRTRTTHRRRITPSAFFAPARAKQGGVLIGEGLQPFFAPVAKAGGASISTPVPAKTPRLKDGSAVLSIQGVKVIIEPDAVSEEKGNGAITALIPAGGDFPSYKTNADGTMKTAPGPAPLVVRIKTTYQAGADPDADSAYGRGTTPEDKKSGNTSLRFHEGSHGTDFLNYLRTHPLPKFTGKAGIPEADYLKARQDYLNAVSQYFQDADADSEMKTDCVGTPASSCPSP